MYHISFTYEQNLKTANIVTRLTWKYFYKYFGAKHAPYNLTFQLFRKHFWQVFSFFSKSKAFETQFWVVVKVISEERQKEKMHKFRSYICFISIITAWCLSSKLVSSDKCECQEVDKQYKCHGDGCGDCHEQPCTPSSGVSRYRLGKVKIWLLKGILAQFD